MGKHSANGERSRVSNFIEELQSHVPVYIYIDQDSPARYTKSGFDFKIESRDLTSTVEAKVTKGKEDPEKKLTDYQKFTRACILASGGTYFVLDFNEDRGTRLIVHRNNFVGIIKEPLKYFIERHS